MRQEWFMAGDATSHPGPSISTCRPFPSIRYRKYLRLLTGLARREGTVRCVRVGWPLDFGGTRQKNKVLPCVTTAVRLFEKLHPTHNTVTSIVYARMAPSQLKQLKALLRENGVTAPQQSRKQKKKAAQNGRDPDKLARRNSALQGIREKFNPFETKAPSRPKKFEATGTRMLSATSKPGIKGRPGVTKGLGEERVS